MDSGVLELGGHAAEVRLDQRDLAVIPPGLAWVPGYWTQNGTGYQWVSGFWNRSGTATALASFSKQMGGNGLVSPFATAPTNPAAASATHPNLESDGAPAE